MSLPLRESVSTGIEYESLFPGLVPLFEEREAAVHEHYTWSEWRTLEPGERAMGVAHYRLHRVIEMHQTDAVSAEIRRRQQQQQGR